MSVSPPPSQPVDAREAPAFLSHRAYTSPFLVRRKSKESGTKSGQTAAARLARKTQSFSEGLEPASGERLADIDVFLGGSCNPTTWRRDAAIPLLEGAHVTYFNPQVDEWFEELIAIETRAKETAKIVLMVIDNLTRSIVCINEAVEYICRGRRVVVVVQDLEDGATVDGKALTPSELGDLNGARECLRSLARRKQDQGSDVHLYPDVASAIDAVITWVTNGDLPRHAPEARRLRKRSSIVLSAWSGHFRFGRRPSRSSSSNALASVVRHKTPALDGHEPAHGTNRSIVRYGGARRNGSVYLGGDLVDASWREEIAVPLLHKACIPFYIPYTDYLSFGLTHKSERLARFPADRWKEIETEKELAELILFVIPRHARSIAAMTEAVELLLSHGVILLVIEPIEEGCIVEESGHRVVGREFKDLARARAYVQETAERNDIQVFSSVAEAVQSIIERLEDGKWPDAELSEHDEAEEQDMAGRGEAAYSSER